jgi:hypothetical protein
MAGRYEMGCNGIGGRMDELLKKLFLDEKGNVSITKGGAAFIAIGLFLDGIPDAASTKGITVVLPEWFRLLTFCFEHVGYALLGIGGVDIVHKYLPRKN